MQAVLTIPIANSHYNNYCAYINYDNETSCVYHMSAYRKSHYYNETSCVVYIMHCLLLVKAASAATCCTIPYMNFVFSPADVSRTGDAP